MGMDLDGLRVQHTGLDQAAQDMRAKVKEIDDRLDRLESELADLRASWAGHQRESYEAAKARWDWAIEQMKVLLDETSRTVHHSNAEYAAADTRGARTFDIRV